MRIKIIIIIVIVVLFVIAGVAAWAVRHKGVAGISILDDQCQKAEHTWGQSVQKNQVVYVDSCFVPNPLTIKAGESVIFTDKNEKEMWIESDKRSDKSKSPIFTSGQSWTIGESYGYQFEKAGTYGFHNRAKPDDQGKIIVN